MPGPGESAVTGSVVPPVPRLPRKIFIAAPCRLPAACLEHLTVGVVTGQCLPGRRAAAARAAAAQGQREGPGVYGHRSLSHVKPDPASGPGGPTMTVTVTRVGHRDGHWH